MKTSIGVTENTEMKHILVIQNGLNRSILA